MATSARARNSVLFILFVVACQKKADPGPPCDQVVDHMFEVTKQMLVGHDAMTKTMRTQAIQQCEQRNMPKDQRECIMAAKDSEGLSACRGAAHGAPPVGQVAPPHPTLPTPPADGGIPAP
jgi:hypothetical protein